jgi:hypothetical protein
LTRDQKLILEVWHADRLQKDQFIGKALVPFAEIIKFPIKKTKQSYVRIFDAFHSIDQYDGEDKPLGKLGELRVIVYLEDLGPSALLAGKSEELADVRPADPGLQTGQRLHPGGREPGRPDRGHARAACHAHGRRRPPPAESHP